MNGHVVSESSGPEVSGLPTEFFAAPSDIEADMPTYGRVADLPRCMVEERGDGEDRDVRMVRKTVR